jgi:hypothetical protein
MVQQPTNAQIAALLDRIADLLEAQEANPCLPRGRTDHPQYRPIGESADP